MGAILAVDAVGYSRLMGKDEEATLKRSVIRSTSERERRQRLIENQRKFLHPWRPAPAEGRCRQALFLPDLGRPDCEIGHSLRSTKSVIFIAREQPGFGPLYLLPTQGRSTACWACRVAVWAATVVLFVALPQVVAVIETVQALDLATGLAPIAIYGALGLLIGLSMGAATDWMCCKIGVRSCC